MTTNEIFTATNRWRLVLGDLLDPRGGTFVTNPSSRGAGWRGRANRELMAYRSRVAMSRPVVLCPERALGYKFMAADAAWVLSGDNRLATIAPYAKRLIDLSDDGRTLTGAYGPPFVDQLGYVTQALHRDPDTRQAVCQIWRPRPGPSGDIPCTIALQWIIREHQLHCVAYMRSSDVWLGLPYDYVTFSTVSAYLTLILRRNGLYQHLTLGDLIVIAGSQHLYDVDADAATRCLMRSDELEGIDPVLDLDAFGHEDELIEHLWAIARRSGVTYGTWLERRNES